MFLIRETSIWNSKLLKIVIIILDWRIEIDSKLDVGITFIIILPENKYYKFY